MSEVEKSYGSITKLLNQKPSKKPSMKKWHLVSKNGTQSMKMTPSKNLVNQSKKPNRRRSMEKFVECQVIMLHGFRSCTSIQRLGEVYRS